MSTKYFVVAILKDGRRARVSCGKTWDVRSYTFNTALKHALDYSHRHQTEVLIERA